MFVSCRQITNKQEENKISDLSEIHASEPSSSQKNCFASQMVTDKENIDDMNSINSKIQSETEYYTEYTERRKENKFLTGRFLCDFEYVIKQSRNVETHMNAILVGNWCSKIRQKMDSFAHFIMCAVVHCVQPKPKL